MGEINEALGPLGAGREVEGYTFSRPTTHPDFFDHTSDEESIAADVPAAGESLQDAEQDDVLHAQAFAR